MGYYSDYAKTVLPKNRGGLGAGIGYALGKAGTGALGIVEGIWDYTAGGIAKLFGDDQFAEDQFANNITGNLSSNLDDWYNPTKGWQVAGDVAGGIGNSLVGIATVAGATLVSGGTLAAPVAKLMAGATIGLGAAGMSTSEAYNKTGQLGAKEFGYGAISGVAEAALEGVTGAAGSVSAKLFAKGTAKNVAQKTVLKGLVSNFREEAIEEGLSEFLDPYFQRWTQVDPKAENATAQEIGYAALIGGLSGALLGGIGEGYSAVRNASRGTQIVNSGRAEAVLDISREFAQYQDENNTNSEAYKYMQGLVSQYESISNRTMSDSTTLKQRQLLAEMERANAVLSIAPAVEESKAKILADTEGFSNYLNSLNIKMDDGSTFSITAEELANNDAILTRYAVSDALGHILMDSKSVYDLTMAGDATTIQNKWIGGQRAFLRFKETASDSEINEVSTLLGVDINSISYEEYIERLKAIPAATFESHKDTLSTMKLAQQAIGEAKVKRTDVAEISKSTRIGDGISLYKDANGEVFAVIKSGKQYKVYTDGKITKSLSRKAVNTLIFGEDQATKETKPSNKKTAAVNTANSTETSTGTSTETAQAEATEVKTTDVATEVKTAESESKADAIEAPVVQEEKAEKQSRHAIAETGAKDSVAATKKLTRVKKEQADSFARKHIKNYDELSEGAKLDVRWTIASGIMYGIDEDTIIALAKLSVDSGIGFGFANITGDGVCYTADNDTTIYLNPHGTRTIETATLHELTHSLRGTDGYELLESEALAYYDKNTKAKEALRKKYEDFYAKNNLVFTEEILNDELTSAYIEKRLGNRKVLTDLVYEKPTFIQRCIDRIKSIRKNCTENTDADIELELLQNKFKSVYNMRKSKKVQDMNAIVTEKKRTEKNNARYEVALDSTGKRTVFINDDILKGVKDPKEQGKVACEYIATHIGEVFSTLSGHSVFIGKDLPKEYVSSNYSFSLRHRNIKIFKDKMTASNSLGEMISISSYANYESNIETKHAIDAKNGWYRFSTRFGVAKYDSGGNFTHYNIYTADLIVRNDSDGVLYLYDVLNINKELKMSTFPNGGQFALGQNSPNNPSSLDHIIATPAKKVNTSSDLELLFDEDFYNQFRNEDKSTISETLEELEKLKASSEWKELSWDDAHNINAKIRAIKGGYTSLYDLYVGEEKARLTKDYYWAIEHNSDNYPVSEIKKKKAVQTKAKQLETDIVSSTPLQNAQFKIIQATNPMFNETSVGIRSPKEIKTFAETINDAESFNWGDFSKEDAEKALKRGTIRVYSSYPIKNGVFVSTSYIQALEYAGNDPSKVHSRIVALDSVAWINGDEGQYAKSYSNSTYYALPIGNRTVDARTVSENEVRTLLDNSFKKQYKDGSYIPVRVNTPSVIINSAESIGKKVENNPVIMNVGKVRQMMSKQIQWIADGGTGRAHNFTTNDVIAMIKAMDNPKQIIYQSADERYVEVVEFTTERKQKAVAVLEVGEHKKIEYLNGFNGGLYQVLITAFEPDVDYVDSLLRKDGNIKIYPKKKGSSQRGSGNKVPSHLNESPFTNSISETGKEVNTSIENITQKYKSKTDFLIVTEYDNTIAINNLVVKSEYRNSGVGTQIVNDVIEYADKKNKTITLTPTKEFGTKERLIKWYKRFGFVENKGKNTDFTIRDTMYRRPTGNKLFALPETDSEGNALTAEQREYFKDSKVVDKDGNLLVVYHGTPYGGFTVFDSTNGIADRPSRANWFTTNTEMINKYYNVERYGGKGENQLYKCFLNLKNPLVVDAKGAAWNQIPTELGIYRYRNINGDIVVSDTASTEDFAKYAQKHNFDGLIIENVRDGSISEEPSTIYGTFDSNQIKLTTNTKPTVDKDIRYAAPSDSPIELSDIKGSSLILTEMPSDRVSLKDVVNGSKKLDTLKAQVKGDTKRYTEVFQILTTNAQAGLERVIKSSGMANAMAMTNYVRAAKYAGFNAIHPDGGQYSLDGETRLGDSLAKIWAPIYKGDKLGKKYNKNPNANAKYAKYKDYLSKFESYLAHYHNIDRYAQGKMVLGEDITSEVSQREVARIEESYPEFRKIAEKTWKFTDNMLELCVESGMYSQEYIDTLRVMYPHYAPTFRAEHNKGIGAIQGKRNMQINNAKKSAVGADTEILPMDDMIAKMVMQRYSSARINKLLVDMTNAFNEKGEYSDDFAIVSSGKTDLDIDEGALVETAKIGDGKYQISFYYNGERVTAEVSKAVYLGIESFVPSGDATFNNILLNGISKVNDVFKKLVTSWNPFFSFFRNPLRDIQEAGLYTRYPMRVFAKNYGVARREIATNGRYWQEAKAAGITSASVYNYESGITVKSENLAKKATRALESASNALEMAPRLAEYISAREAGLSVQEALLQAQDVTTNFGRGGTFAKKLNSTIMPFLNPSIQGFSKMVRAFTGKDAAQSWVNLIVRSILLGIGLTALNDILNGDDEDYQNLSDYVKENNYVIAIGNGDFAKIPKGRVIGVIGGAFLRAKNFSEGDEKAFDGYLKNIASQVTPVDNVARNIFSPFKDIKNNVTWYGGTIESQKWANTQAKDRYDEGTSSISIWLGQVFDYSPIKIDYLLQQYGGIVADIALPATTLEAEKGIAAQNVLVNGITNSKWSTRFYNKLEDYNYAKTSGDNIAKGVVKYLNSVNGTIADMNAQKREIQSDSELSDSEKLKQVKIVQAAINALEKESLENAEYLQQELAKYDLSETSFDSSWRDAVSAVVGEDYALMLWCCGVDPIY